jgi:hypothetical protein
MHALKSLPAGQSSFLPFFDGLSPAASKLSRSALLAFQEEAVICIARINEASDDRPSRVDVTGEGALAWACARARGVKRGEGAVASPHEAMVTIGIKRARDSALRADSNTVSALEEAMGSAWGVERNDGGLPLVSIRGKDEPRCDQANRERQQERRAGRHTLQ